MKWTKELLQKKVDEIFGEKITIISEPNGSREYVVVETKYGLVKARPTNLIRKYFPTIESAIDKTDYFAKELEDIFGKKISLVSKYDGARSEVIVRDNYGDMSSLPTNLRKGKLPGIKSAINEGKYIYNLLCDKNKDIYFCDNISYHGQNTVVDGTCLIHGKISRTISLWISHSGCPKCSQNRGSVKTSLSQKEFEERVFNKHGDKYDLSESKYVGQNVPVEVVCKEHGHFKCRPYSLWNATGCPKCLGEIKRNMYSSNKDEFVERARLIHGDKYSYDNVQYTNARIPTMVLCKKHGEWSVSPESHLRGSGCPKCNKVGFPKEREKCREGMIYIIKCFSDEEEFFKVGFSMNGARNRFGKGQTKVMPYGYRTLDEIIVKDAEWIERTFHRANIDKRYLPNIEFGGMWECYEKDPTEMLKDHIAKILEDKDGKQKETGTVS